MLRKIASALAAFGLLASTAAAQSSAQLPAERFVDPVSAYSGTISPSGAYIAYIARTNDQQQLYVVDIAAQEARVIQTMSERVGDFRAVWWKGDDRLIISVVSHEEVASRARTGTAIRSEAIQYDIYRIVAINRDGTNPVQMFQGQMNRLYYGYGSTFLIDELRNDPQHVLIGARDNAGVGVWRANTTTGEVERVINGSEDTRGYVTDGDGVAVMRVDYPRDGTGYRVFRRAPTARNWTQVVEVRNAAYAESPDFVVGESGPASGQVYVYARLENSDVRRLYLYNTATGEFTSPLQSADQDDIADAWFSPLTHQVVATCEEVQRYQCQALDPAMQRHLTGLERAFQGQATFSLVDMSDDGNRWLLYADGPTVPGAYYLYDVTTRNVSPVANARPNVDPGALSPTEVVNYQARDGTQLWAYVTARPGVSGPRPTVILPHGGPEVRDSFGYHPFVQFLASRGYVVVQPNFRGGSGFGRAFADAGRGQWGLRMQDDVSDAVQHLIQAGVADPQRICIVGASYGGYVALEGVASTPELYRCAVSISGVSDLIDMLRAEGEDGRQLMNYQYWLRSIGDPNANRAALEAASPRRNASSVTAPVLLIHGDEDDIVPIRQSELMQRALGDQGRRPRLIELDDEGHYWDEWSEENRLTVFRETEAFLAQHIGH